MRLSSSTSCFLTLLGALACSSPTPPPASPQKASPSPGAAQEGSGPAPSEAPKQGCACQLKLRKQPETAASSPAPVKSELPRPPFDFERRSACIAPVCRLDAWLPDEAFVETTREGVPSPGAVWLETLADQSTLVLPPHAELEAVALVLEGQVAYGEGERSKAAGAPVLPAWSALRASHAGFSLTARSGKASVLVAVLSRRGTLGEAIERGRRKDAPKPEKTTLEVADLSSSPKLEWSRGATVARVAFPASPAPSLSLLQVSGQSELPETAHSAEWEYIAIVRGSGDLVLGNARYPATPGAIFHVPRGTVHGWKGRGDDLAAVTIFSPGGPEQRYVEAAAKEAPHP